MDLDDFISGCFSSLLALFIRNRFGEGIWPQVLGTDIPPYDLSDGGVLFFSPR